MSEANKDIVERWFKALWGEAWNPDVLLDLAAPDILIHSRLHESKRGRATVTEFITDLRRAFPDLRRWAVDDLIMDGNRVAVRWETCGTHTGPAYGGFRMGSLVAATGRQMRFSGMTVFRVEDHRIAEEWSEEDALAAMLQLDLLRMREVASAPWHTPLPPGWNRLPAA